MEVLTVENSRIIELKVMEGYIMSMEIFIWENGEMIKRMAMEHINLSMEAGIKEIGKPIKGTEQARKYGLMEPSFKVPI